MAKESQSGSDTNLLLAVAGLTFFAGVSALAVAWISGSIIESFQNTQNVHALFITQGGLVTDDKVTGQNLNRASDALKACRDFGWALAVGCLGVGVAVLTRLRRQNAS
jgi:hypothetical protein